MRDLVNLTEAFLAIASGATADSLESPVLEFKAVGRSRDDALKTVTETVICFANGERGGVLVVGVEDHVPGTKAFTGCDIPLESVKQRVRQLTADPMPTFFAEERNEYGARLVILFVPASANIHSDTQGRAYRRVGTSCDPMTPAEIAILRETRTGGFDWSRESSNRLRSEALVTEISRIRRMIETFQREPDLGRLADVDLLTTLGLAYDGNLTRAGELLLCQPRNGAYPLVVYVHRRRPGAEPTIIRRLAPPLLAALDQVEQLLEARAVRTPVNLLGGQQIHVPDYPPNALREIIANAFVHRDYRLPSPVTIDHSPELLTISSPGPLVGNVKPTNILTHAPVSRNPTLARAVSRFGLVEEAGLGVDRAFREAIRAGKPLPVIESEPDSVRVTLHAGETNAALVRYIHSESGLPEDFRTDTDALLCLHVLTQQRAIEASAMREVLQRSLDQTVAILRSLARPSAGILHETTKPGSPNPKFELGANPLNILLPGLQYEPPRSGKSISKAQRRAMDKIILDYLKSNPTITFTRFQDELAATRQVAESMRNSMLTRRLIAPATSPDGTKSSDVYARGANFPLEAGDISEAERVVLEGLQAKKALTKKEVLSLFGGAGPSASQLLAAIIGRGTLQKKKGGKGVPTTYVAGPKVNQEGGPSA